MIGETMDLGGLWEFSTPQGKKEKRRVPGSYHCVGSSLYARDFFYCQSGGDKKARALLCFEGIAYEGAIALNGTEIGEMLPYSRYEFDVTKALREGDNRLELYLKDINAVFGPAEGWSSYGGIVRSVCLRTVPETYLADIVFRAPLSGDLTRAECAVEISLGGGTMQGLTAEVTLAPEGEPSAQAGHACAAVVGLSAEARFSVSHPRLWSPETPALYRLTVTLQKDGAVIETAVRTVGFKRFEIRGSRFFLNNRPIFLCGVCRHDLQTDRDGFTQTQAQIDRDLTMIKQLGCNYVRLVHYPHDPRVVETADRLGLLVSEEPGLWWSDLHDPAITSRALEVLKKVIRRDRSRVSVAFWLAFNECVFTREFLHDAAAAARSLDPTRPVSGANCMNVKLTKELFDGEGFDFYTFHPYGSRPDQVTGGYGGEQTSLAAVAQALSGKPLVFTEWGGYFVQDNPALFADFCSEMIAMGGGDAPSLAGMSYWAWQDIYEAERGLPACADGILNEGLVTVDRKRRVNYDTYAHLLADMRAPEKPSGGRAVLYGAGDASARYLPVDMAGAAAQNQEAAWAESIRRSLPMAGMAHKKLRSITHGPALPEKVCALGCLTVDLPAGRPLVAAAGETGATGAVAVPVGRAAKAVWFVGQCSFSFGYPLGGSFGEEAGRYVIRYDDGGEQTIELRNGLELTTVQGLYGPSMIDPRAAHVSRAVTISYDRSWEIYHVGLLRIETRPGAVIREIVLEPENKAYSILLYGVTLED